MRATLTRRSAVAYRQAAEKIQEEPMSDPFRLERFVAAQNADDTYERALAELRAGRKQGHWMWFIFPQIAGLGGSPMARRYAISSVDEARAYLRHPVLGPRLIASTAALLRLGTTVDDALGEVDAMKLCSSMTLFAYADPTEPLFTQVLDTHYGGVADPLTEARL